MALPRTPAQDARSRGVAMVAALGLMAVASAVMLLLFLRTMDELQHGRDDSGIVQSLLVAHGGVNMGVSLLRSDIRGYLNQIASGESNSSAPWSFGSSGVNADQPTPSSVANDLRPVASQLQARIDALVCGPRDLSDGQTLNLRIYVTDSACGVGLPAGTRLGDGRFVQGNRREQGGAQRYALPFVMVAEGTQGEYRRQVVTQGEYQFDVGRASFARYALFTDVHVSESGGSRIWFTGDTLFDGPVHTNGNFNFYDRPWFGGTVSSAGQTQGVGQGAYGYNGSNGRFFGANSLDPGGNTPDLSTQNHTNRPEFLQGVDWRSEYIALPENAFDQRALAAEDGILFTREMDYLEIFAGDASGNPVAANADPPAAFQYVRARTRSGPGNSAWTVVTYRIAPSGSLERQNANGSWSLVTPQFNGVIYSEEYIPRLTGPGRTNSNQPGSARPAVAAFAQLTIVPEEGARITSDLVYEDQPCTGSLRRGANNQVVRAECENLDAVNVLGIFSPGGDIEIGHNNWDADHNAPRDVRIQASILTSNGVVRVEDYNQGSDRGAVQLLGGIIEERYGAFGTFTAGGGMSTGYSREFTFDPRMGLGLAPPFFPTVGIDGVKDVYTYTFGHREQVY